MERGNKRPLINELTQGKELTHQLKNYLDKPMSMSTETCELLVGKILSSFEKGLSMLNWGTIPLEDPNTFSGEISPGTDASEHLDSDSNNLCTKNAFKKRKTMTKWSEQVKVCSGSMVEGPLSDGHSWRKYGQKDILGANHPRAYYRCTHRNVQGCLATKQVQRSDEDSSIFEITYRGRHTCIQATQLSKALEKKPKKEVKEEAIQDLKPIPHMHRDHGFNFNPNKEVKEVKDERVFPSFSFASTPIETEKLENLFYLGGDVSNYITLDHNLQSSDSELSELMNSTPNSVSNSPFGDWGEDFNNNLFFDLTDLETFA